MKKNLPFLLSLLLATGIAWAQEAPWNLGATAPERAGIAKKLRCGVQTREGPATVFNVPRVVENRTKIHNEYQSHKAIRIGPAAEVTFAIPTYKDKKKVAAEIARQKTAWLSGNAISVYPSSAIDCFVAALSNMTFEQRALSNSIVDRLNRSEADAVEAETLTELLVRVERLEEELRRLKGGPQKFERTREISDR